MAIVDYNDDHANGSWADGTQFTANDGNDVTRMIDQKVETDGTTDITGDQAIGGDITLTGAASRQILRDVDNQRLYLISGTAAAAANGAWITLYGETEGSFPGNAYVSTGASGSIYLRIGTSNKLVIDNSGDTTITGDLAVTGTVDGRDVAADGTVLDSLNQSAGMKAQSGGGQTIATATWTKLDWVTTLFADNGIVSDVTTDDDFTILVAGTYEITLWVSCGSVLANFLRLSYDVSGGLTYGSHYKDLTPVAGVSDKFHASWAVDLAASATVDLWLYHTEGVDRAFMGSVGNQCWIKRIG